MHELRSSLPGFLPVCLQAPGAFDLFLPFGCEGQVRYVGGACHRFDNVGLQKTVDVNCYTETR